MELVCLTCGAQSEGFNVRVSRIGYPHKDDCRVQDIRPKATVASVVAAPKAAEQETPLPEPTEEKPKKKRKAPKKKESSE